MKKTIFDKAKEIASKQKNTDDILPEFEKFCIALFEKMQKDWFDVETLFQEAGMVDNYSLVYIVFEQWQESFEEDEY